MKDNKLICILDYGSGNVRSVKNLIEYLGYSVIVSNDKQDIKKSSHLILPGVGAFGSAIVNIKNKIPLSTVEGEVFDRNKPFLGICVGMQVLSDTGYEYGEHQGLGWIKGKVDKLDSKQLPLPHIGWNDVIVKSEEPLFFGLDNNLDFYFVHSFRFIPDDDTLISSNVNYGTTFCSSIQMANIFGVQFHPEKSQKAGEILMKNFLELK